MQDIHDKDYLILANEAVWNEGSRTSLLSEFQIREKWYHLKEHFNNNNNIEDKNIIIGNQYDVNYTDKYTGGLFGFLSTVSTHYFMMNNADPTNLFHSRETPPQEIMFVRNQLAGTDYSSEVYKLYVELREYSSFEEYMQHLKNYNDFEDVRHSPIGTAKACMVNTESEESVASDLQADLRKLLAAYNTDRRAPTEQGMFIPNAVFRLLKELSPDTMDQFMKLRQENNPHPSTDGTTRPPTEGTTSKGNAATENMHPKLTMNGLPRQYGTNGTARGNLTEPQNISGQDR
jgi:hypothetical protein